MQERQQVGEATIRNIGGELREAEASFKFERCMSQSVADFDER